MLRTLNPHASDANVLEPTTQEYRAGESKYFQIEICMEKEI